MPRITLEAWDSVVIPTNGGNGETIVEVKNADEIEDAEVIIDVVGGDVARYSAWPAIKMMGGDPQQYHVRKQVSLSPLAQTQVPLLYAGAMACVTNRSSKLVVISH